jgi:hypothetical protein
MSGWQAARTQPLVARLRSMMSQVFTPKSMEYDESKCLQTHERVKQSRRGGGGGGGGTGAGLGCPSVVPLSL